MKKLKQLLPVGFWVIWSAAVPMDSMFGAPVMFTVDPTQSQVTLSGNLVAFSSLSAPITAQSSGSLTTSYNGNINADVSGTTIQFTGSSLITAQTNSLPQQPAPGGVSGSAPADYGGMAQKNAFFTTITLDIALRNAGLDITSPMLTLSSGDFASTSLQFSFSTNVNGTIDYLDNIGDSGTAGLVGSSTDASSAPASLTTTGSVQVLTIPVNMTFTDTSAALNGTTLIMVGQIVATRTIFTPPNINSINVTNQMVVLTVAYATAQSQVLVSHDLNHWSAQTTSVTNRLNLTIFTFAGSGDAELFRVEQ